MKKLLALSKGFWACTMSVGEQKAENENDVKYVRFTNVVAILTSLAVVLYIPLSLYRGYYMLAMLQGFDVLCVLSVLWFNHTGHNVIARHIYILVINSFVLINSCLIGHESRVDDFFYIAYIVPFLLFSVKDYRNIIIGVLGTIIFFNIYQHIYPQYTQYNLDLATQQLIAGINLWMKFVLFGVAIYILSYYNFNTEAELAQTNQKLEKQAEELKRSNKDLEQFAAIISHDLKAPVRNVSSFMTLLLRRYRVNLEPEAVNFIELSKNSTDRMARQIDDLLAYSKLARNLPEPGSIDINTLIKTIEIEFGEKLLEKNARIIIEQYLPTVRNVHTSMLHHVFQNLIANAIKFNTNPHPQVRISSTETADKYVFKVSDNGIGIDNVFQDKLFNMFSRLHSENEFEGSGVGLAVCRKIVEFYAGTIWFESVTGKGTDFYFSIPKLNFDNSRNYQARFIGSQAHVNVATAV